VKGMCTLSNRPDVEKGTPAERLLAVGVALFGVLGKTGAFITIRAIGKRAHTLHLLVAFSTLCLINAGAGMVIKRITIVVPTSLDSLFLLAVIGIFGFVSQICLVMGLKRETAGRATLAIYLQIIFATILERIFLHFTPSILSVIGGVIILVSAVYVALSKTKALEKLPDRDPSSGQDEEAAIERGLLQGAGTNANYTKL